MYVCMCVCMYVCMYVCTYVCMYVYMYVCIYVSIYESSAFVKVKLAVCLYKPGLQEVEAPRISRQSAHKVASLSALRNGRL